MNNELTWYIEYDNRTFSILNKPKFEKHIYKVAQGFVEAQVCPPSLEIEVSEWVPHLADAVKEISQLLYNFFYVEEKLTSNEVIKLAFLQIHTVLRVENLYSNFFYIFSENFRLNRILAECIRLNRFMEKIFESINNIRKSLEKNFLDNLDEVYIFMQQKIKETLARTEKLGAHDLNIILLDMLSLLLRNFGDSTMGKILDKTHEKKLIDVIEKENEVYQEFEEGKKKEQMVQQSNCEYEFDGDVEEDPKMKRLAVAEVEEEVE